VTQAKKSQVRYDTVVVRDEPDLEAIIINSSSSSSYRATAAARSTSQSRDICDDLNRFLNKRFFTLNLLLRIFYLSF
jgi:hypothetical protein